MPTRRNLSWAAAMRDLRRDRKPRSAVPAVTFMPPALNNLDGSFNRAGIMHRAHELARKCRFMHPGTAWSAVMAQALSHAWWEAKLAHPRRQAA